MSEAEQRAGDLSRTGGNSAAAGSEPDAATSGTGGGDMPDRTETGVRLGAGEPDTFEPEEAAPEPEAPPE
jgi:hypothetical protein